MATNDLVMHFYSGAGSLRCYCFHHFSYFLVVLFFDIGSKLHLLLPYLGISDCDLANCN